METTTLDVREIQSLEILFFSSGFNKDDVKYLLRENVLYYFLDFLHGHREVIISKADIQSAERPCLNDYSAAIYKRLSFFNYSPADLKALSQEENLKTLLYLIRHQAELRDKAYLIDLGLEPVLPSGYIIKEHCIGGLSRFCKDNYFLHNPSEKEEEIVSGTDFYYNVKRLAALQGAIPANINVLNSFDRRTNFIPEEWKLVVTLFWGTACSIGGHLMIPNLFFHKETSTWRKQWAIINSLQLDMSMPALFVKV